MKNKANLSNFDELYTPRYIIEPLMEFMNTFPYLKTLRYLEPFSYNGCNIPSVMKKHGYEVYQSGLQHNKKIDFFDITKRDLNNSGIDIIISNPPFSKKTQVLEHTVFNLKTPFIYLLPLDCMGSLDRQKVFSAIDRDMSVLFFNKRANFMNITQFNNKSGYQKDLCFLTNVELFRNKMLIINDRHKSAEDGIIRKLTFNEEALDNKNKEEKDKIRPTKEESNKFLINWKILSDEYYADV